MLEQLQHILANQHTGRIRIDLFFSVGESDLQVSVEINGLFKLDYEKEILPVELKRDVNKSAHIVCVTPTLVLDAKSTFRLTNTAYFRCSTFIDTKHFENFILFLMLVVFPSLTDAEKLNSPELVNVGVRTGNE